MFELFDRLANDVLMEQLLGLNFVRRVQAHEFWKFHFENPVDVQIIKYYVEGVSLGALGVVEEIAEELQDIF